MRHPYIWDPGTGYKRTGRDLMSEIGSRPMRTAIKQARCSWTLLYFKLSSVLMRDVSNDYTPPTASMACWLSQVKFTITTPDRLLLVMYDWKADIQVITLSRYSVMGIILLIMIINIIIASVMVIIVIVIFIDKHCLNYSLKPLFFILKLVSLCF